MKRTISFKTGNGSYRHNNRTFTAENVDPERSRFNINYCNIPIRKVYHELFDEALENYNAKQTRKDRQIKDYYKHIESGKQEKLFHEVIMQVGNKDDMSATGEHAELAKTILDEYYRGFQDRNPHLKVFSAHLHMDEATPHLHIDFVPFTTGSKRGLETRVSLKKALEQQGFRGKGRGDTEWSHWAQSEKEQLAKVMRRYGIRWEQKGTHEIPLSVLDYKKQERAKEVEALDNQIEVKESEVRALEERVAGLKETESTMEEIEEMIQSDTELELPEPQGLITAKSYKKKFVEPIISKLKSLVKTLAEKYFEGWNKYYELCSSIKSLRSENDYLRSKNSKLTEVNEELRKENRAYQLLKKYLGKDKIEDIGYMMKTYKNPKIQRISRQHEER
ncbi:MAG: plasmid recombination protein [Ruminococcus sp.]|nr:plasmid recombination protein [Ruminococcus sp.]